jgi:hypothetical protein
MASKNKNLPEWGGGRSGFKTPATPQRISRRAATAAADSGGKKAKGTKALTKKK